MKKFIVKRAGLALVSLFLLSLTIFFLMRVTGDPAVLLAEPGASHEAKRVSPSSLFIAASKVTGSPTLS